MTAMSRAGHARLLRPINKIDQTGFPQVHTTVAPAGLVATAMAMVNILMPKNKKQATIKTRLRERIKERHALTFLLARPRATETASQATGR